MDTPAHHHPKPAADTRSVLASHGLRCTMQRELIFDALMQAHTHPTADELFRTVRPRHPGLSLATVYNTLEALTDAGLVRRLAPGPGEPHASFRYDADTSDHVHLVTPDGLVRDVPEAVSHAVAQRLSPDLIRELEAAIGAPIARIRVEIVQAAAPTPAAPASADLCDKAP